LNLGILAHVDAGKTSLTERLLFAAGAIDEPGSVDAGNTQTDSLELERRRGITIRSAVVSFAVGGVAVNLIDTPGHPEFIAEVERVLDVLDGAVLVVSAVEGVQAQTRVLMRTLQRLCVPTLVFVNKLDRRGARPGAVIEELRRRLGLAAIRADGAGALERLAERDQALLAAYVAGTPVGSDRLRAALAAQSRAGAVHPVFLGSARTGEGVDALLAGLPELLPHDGGGDDGAPASGTVFKIERDGGGGKLAYVRMRAGALRVREHVPLNGGDRERITGLEVFTGGTAVPAGAVHAGQIARVRGLAGARIGDSVGAGAPPGASRHHFAPPTLETVIRPADPGDRRALRVALDRLAEEDPLIGVRHSEPGGELALTLYGEVQKQVIAATLLEDHGVAARFEASTTIHIERPVGTGSAVEFIGTDPNPILATVGLRVEPLPPGAGLAFELDVELGSMPLAYFTAVEESVTATLAAGGLHGWRVEDCRVTMTHSGYWAKQSSGHAAFDKSMSSTARDFRDLTPVVLLRALAAAGTVVCEPVHRFKLEAPADVLGLLLPALGALGGVPDPPEHRSSAATIASSRASFRPRACTRCARDSRPSRAARACWRRRSPTTARCGARRRRTGAARPRRSGRAAGGDAPHARRACPTAPSCRARGRRARRSRAAG
jgi:ribosomal protection tetracycline resistance protein